MKIIRFCRISLPIILLLNTLSNVSGKDDTNNTSETVLGNLTNGIRAEIELIKHPESNRSMEIIVWINQPSVANFTPEEMERHLQYLDWPYYLPTNCFCGPLELRGSAGRILPNLKPEITSLTNYPLAYSLRAAHANFLRQFSFYSGPGIFPLPLMATSPRTEMLRFQFVGPIKTKDPSANNILYQRQFPLTDYFSITNSGEYRLTVWPKIYYRASANDDVCRRIDVPPVTIKFKIDLLEKKNN